MRVTKWTPSAASVPFGIVPANALGISYPATIGVAPWDAPIAGNATSLMTPSTALQYYSPSGSSSGPVTVTTTTAPGPRWINFQGSLFGLGYGAASQLADAGGTYKINASAVLKSALSGGTPVSNQSRTIQLGSYGTATQSQDSSGTVYWIESSNSWQSTRAPGNWNASDRTNVLSISNLGFSIPAGQTILGIQVAFAVAYANSSGSPVPADSLATLSGGSGTPSNLATLSGEFIGRNNSYGGSSALWGMTWTPAQINSSSFGFNWQLINNTGSLQTLSSFYSSTGTSLTVTVYYQPSAPIYPAPSALTGAPTGAVDITQYQARIWLAGGCDVPGSATTHEPTTIFWTNPVTSTNPLTNTTADWRYTDPVSGITTTNKVVIDQNGADPVMGFGRVTGAMIIFRRSSVYVLKGTTTANYQITKISGNVGCLDPRSIIESDEGVYFMSLQGLMLTNGSRVTSVSTGVEQAMQSALQYEQAVVLAGSSNAQTGWVSSGITSQGHIAVSIGVVGTSAAGALPLPTDIGVALAPTTMRTLWSGVYDPGTGSWYRITSFLFGIDSGLWNPSTFIGVPDGPQLFVSNRLVGQRSLHVVGNAGITTLEDQSLSFSFLTSSALFDTVSSGLPGIISPEVGPTQGLAIPAHWHTKTAPIVGTSSIDRRFGMPTRFFFDHALSVANASASTDYDATAGPSSNVATLTSLSGAGTAWSIGTASALSVPVMTAAANTVIGAIPSFGAGATSNVLTMIPPMNAVPAGATITGVTVVLFQEGLPATNTYTANVQLLNAGAAIGTAFTGVPWSSAPGLASYGGSSNLWGAALTPVIVNSGTFGVSIQVTNTSGTTGSAYVYLANVIIYYTTAGGTPASVSCPTWVVTPYDSDGNAYPVSLSCAVSASTSPADPRSGPSIVTPVTSNTILRESLDFNNEVANLTFDVTLPAIQAYTSVLTGTTVLGPAVALTPANNVVGEVYGVGVEYQTAHDLRSKTT